MFYSFFSYFFKLWEKVLSFFYLKHSNKIEPTIVQRNFSFNDIAKSTFLKSIENLNDSKNSNIDSFFYNKKEYRTVMEEPNNSIENAWKRRILMRSIPQGTNIIMFYDPYKLGFSYYCDQNISYNILNSIAMNYVLLYKCYDFFLDECITPEPSPILKLLEDDKPDEKDNNVGEKQKKEDKEFKELLKKAPIAKFKNYNKPEIKPPVLGKEPVKKTSTSVCEKTENLEKPEKPEKPKERNRFIYLGKICNFSFLQKSSKKQVLQVLDSSLMKSGLFANTSVQKEVFHYRDFKKLKTATVA